MKVSVKWGELQGLGLLTKYQMALVAVCVVLWWLRIGGWRQSVHRHGLLLAVLLAALVFAPHLLWLAQAEEGPLRYAAESSLGAHLPLARRPGHAALWLLDWLGNRLLPAWLLLGVTAWALARWRADDRPPPERPARLARDYLLLWGLGPMLQMAALNLLAGIHLQMKWSTAFALWTVPALLALLPPRWRVGAAAVPRVAWWTYVLLQVVLMAVTLWSAQAMRQHPMRQSGWTQRDVAVAAAALADPARQALGGPVQVINGPYGVAGMLALWLPEQPLVMIDGDPAKSPWLQPQHLANARTISVWPEIELSEGAHWLMPGWAWWPRAMPPSLGAGSQDERRRELREGARRDGGTAGVAVP